MSRFVYHYYAIIQLEDKLSQIICFDGIAKAECEIGDYDDYNELKQLILDEAKLNQPITRLSICSLTLLKSPAVNT